MPSSLTFQTDREIRYERRCQRKRIEQQNLDRTIRLQNRETYKNENVFNREEIKKEVTSVISVIKQTHRFAPRHFRNYSSYSSLRY
jgi:hypothetical protein